MAARMSFKLHKMLSSSSLANDCYGIFKKRRQQKRKLDQVLVIGFDILLNLQAAYYINMHKTTQPIESSGNITQLVCACNRRLSGVKSCSEDGYNVTIRKGYWAGVTAGYDIHNSSTSRAPIEVNDLSIYMKAAIEAQQNFATGNCFSAVCSHKVFAGSWSLRSINPCQALYKRTGALCSDCQSNYSRVPLDLFVSHS